MAAWRASKNFNAFDQSEESVEPGQSDQLEQLEVSDQLEQPALLEQLARW
jgi:hypothetical protein